MLGREREEREGEGGREGGQAMGHGYWVGLRGRVEREVDGFLLELVA